MLKATTAGPRTFSVRRDTDSLSTASLTSWNMSYPLAKLSIFGQQATAEASYGLQRPEAAPPVAGRLPILDSRSTHISARGICDGDKGVQRRPTHALGCM